MAFVVPVPQPTIAWPPDRLDDAEFAEDIGWNEVILTVRRTFFKLSRRVNLIMYCISETFVLLKRLNRVWGRVIVTWVLKEAAA